MSLILLSRVYSNFPSLSVRATGRLGRNIARPPWRPFFPAECNDESDVLRLGSSATDIKSTLMVIIRANWQPLLAAPFSVAGAKRATIILDEA